MPTVTFNERQIKEFVEIFKPFLEEAKNEYMLFFFKMKGASVSIYKSGKVVFQGSNLEMFKDYIKLENHHYKYNNMNTIGSDEVGTGDAFGPIVAASAFAPKNLISKLIELGVTDSKLIDDEKIMALGPKLNKLLPHRVIIVRPETFNDKQKSYNMNKMKALIHNQNIQELVKVTNYEVVCLDQFCEEKTYYSYLKPGYFDKVSFEMKGETKSLAVASASIIARYYFLLEMDMLSKKYGYNLPKGSGIKADEMIKKIREDGKEDILYHIAKLSFKNFNK